MIDKFCAACGRKLYRYNVSGYCQSCWPAILNKERMGSNHHAWTGNKVGYLGKHNRVYHRRGKASEYNCMDCGKQALDWSKIHGKSGTKAKHYEPRCRSCHMIYDPRKRDNSGKFAS